MILSTVPCFQKGGLAILALPSRNRKNEPNILSSVINYPNQFSSWESINAIVTEYGIVNISGRTVRERAQGLIDIAHPDDRQQLIEDARKNKIIYPDQIYIKESAHLYPSDINIKLPIRCIHVVNCQFHTTTCCRCYRGVIALSLFRRKSQHPPSRYEIYYAYATR